MKKKNNKRKHKKKTNTKTLSPFIILIGVIVLLCAILGIFKACEQRHSEVASVKKTTRFLSINIKEKHIGDGIIPPPEDEGYRPIEHICVNLHYEYPAIPKNIPSALVSHTGYTLSFNNFTHCPNWVAWDLSSAEADGSFARSNNYKADDSIPYKDRVNETAFSGSGYDRGHMCPAADMKWSEKSMSDSFYMTNMCPQAPTLNQTWWEHLESACKRWAKSEGLIYICCGPIYEGGESSIDCNPPVKIPSAFFKVVLSLRSGHEKAIGFYYRNDDSRQPMGDAVRTVDEIEQITGYDFFPLLEDELENSLESMKKLGKWK